jgi:hypothetical protein
MKKRIYINLDINKVVLKKRKHPINKSNEELESPLNVSSNKINEDIYREQYQVDLKTKSSKNSKRQNNFL